MLYADGENWTPRPRPVTPPMAIPPSQPPPRRPLPRHIKIKRQRQVAGNTPETMNAKQLMSFWGRIDRSGGDDACWPWLGKLDNGYGRVRLGGKHFLVHRVSYELIRGALTPGKHLHHSECRNKSCCNPWHLKELTPAEHTLIDDHVAGRQLSKTHCPRGHKYDIVVGAEKRYRACSICQKENTKQAWQREKESMSSYVKRQINRKVQST